MWRSPIFWPRQWWVYICTWITCTRGSGEQYTIYNDHVRSNPNLSLLYRGKCTPYTGNIYEMYPQGTWPSMDMYLGVCPSITFQKATRGTSGSKEKFSCGLDQRIQNPYPPCSASDLRGMGYCRGQMHCHTCRCLTPLGTRGSTRRRQRGLCGAKCARCGNIDGQSPPFP